jgi:lanthanide-dependent methanol dehydrogenase
MAPLVVKGKVLIGNSGGEMGVRGWLTAVDANTGQIVWRAYHTGPDKDVLIGPNFKPQYPQNKGEDLGVKSWPPEHWKIGGGTMWGWIQYDPETNTIFYGTGNPGPWNSDARPGDNLWTCTMFARDADTGGAKWAVQFNPHDLWDYDEINESVLIDLPINGATRKVILHPSRNGHMYVLDRMTGEILSADAYDYIYAVKGIDLKSGRPIEVPEKHPTTGKTITDICPVHDGAKDWQPTAWSPRTKYLYVPHQHMCMNLEVERSRLYRRHPICRRHCRHLSWSRRLSWRIHGLGSGSEEEGLRDQGELPSLDWHGRHSWRRGLLRYDGPLV